MKKTKELELLYHNDITWVPKSEYNRIMWAYNIRTKMTKLQFALFYIAFLLFMIGGSYLLRNVPIGW